MAVDNIPMSAVMPSTPAVPDRNDNLDVSRNLSTTRLLNFRDTPTGESPSRNRSCLDAWLVKTRHWYRPSVMVAFLLLGITLAVGHHRYYNMLHGLEVGSSTSQQWSLRYVCLWYSRKNSDS